jgi:hypothetical protein
MDRLNEIFEKVNNMTIQELIEQAKEDSNLLKIPTFDKLNSVDMEYYKIWIPIIETIIKRNLTEKLVNALVEKIGREEDTKGLKKNLGK